MRSFGSEDKLSGSSSMWLLARFRISKFIRLARAAGTVWILLWLNDNLVMLARLTENNLDNNLITTLNYESIINFFKYKKHGRKRCNKDYKVYLIGNSNLSTKLAILCTICSSCHVTSYDPKLLKGIKQFIFLLSVIIKKQLFIQYICKLQVTQTNSW